MAAGGNRTSENRSAYDPATDAVKVTAIGADGLALAIADGAGYPEGVVILGGSSGNQANALAAVTLAKASGQMSYLTGFDMTFLGATGASTVLATVTGLAGGTRTYVIAVPAGVAVRGEPLVRSFSPPLPAADFNTDIVVSLPALGAGNTNAVVNAHGFRF